LWATIIGVFGGLIGITFLVVQTLATKEAAKAAKASAESALKSSQAIINAERPWLLIEIETGVIKQVGSIADSIWFSISFRNCGKTPAEVVNFDQHPVCRQNLEDLPSPPKYVTEGKAWAHTRMVPAGAQWSDPGESRFIPSQFLPLDQWKDIRESRKRFIYWGRLQYRDLIEDAKTIHELEKVGTIHETCFCYFWSPPLNEFFICGPLGYNKHT
jgi:hypothetical protein